MDLKLVWIGQQNGYLGLHTDAGEIRAQSFDELCAWLSQHLPGIPADQQVFLASAALLLAAHEISPTSQSAVLLEELQRQATRLQTLLNDPQVITSLQDILHLLRSQKAIGVRRLQDRLWHELEATLQTPSS